MSTFKLVKNFFVLSFFSILLSSCLKANRYHYPASVHSHKTGRAKPDSTSWLVGNGDPTGHMSYGPYTTELPEGMVQAIFLLQTDSVANPDLNVLQIDVHDANSNQILAKREIYLRDFDPEKLSGIFSLNFLNNLKSRIEFRIYYKGKGNFEHIQTSAVGLSDTYKFTENPKFGFNHSIWKYESGNFGVTPMTSEERVLRQNFSLMASLGTKYVRMQILNQSSGFRSTRKECQTPSQGCAGADLDYATMDNIINNVIKDGGILDIAHEYGITIIPMFHANSFYWDVWSFSYNWWDSYGASQAGFNRWIADASAWVNHIVSGIDASPKAARSVLYYDLWNEFDHYSDRKGLPAKSGLIRALLQNVNVGAAKRGLSMIYTCEIPQAVKSLSDSLSKPIKYIEIHSYPEKDNRNDRCGENDLRTGEKIKSMMNGYPGATYLLGEYSASRVADESENADIEMTTYIGPSSARSANVMAALHWRIWDDGPSLHGLGENIDRPRDAYGRYTDLPLNNVIESGGDFERVNSEIHWEVLGRDSTFKRVIAEKRAEAATGQAFLRFHVKQSTDRLCTPEMEGAAKKVLFLSGYIRQSDVKASTLTLDLKTGDDFVQPIKIKRFNSQSFKNLSALYPMGLRFNVEGMKTFQLCISTTGASANSFIDLDAMSLNGF